MTRARSNRSGFEQRLVGTLREHGMFPGVRLTVAFSGGSDSLALAAALARVVPLLKLELLLVHVDHRLRPSSGNDARACEDLAKRLEVPINIVALEPGLPDRAGGIGLEEAARRERYVALAVAAASWSSKTIVLGHQANDQAETLLLHLFRGAGLDGLAGMRAREPRTIPWWVEVGRSAHEFELLRPLLGETRATIDAYVASHGFEPVHDESNDAVDFDRNWVRHQILPAILERWPSAIDTLQRSARALSVDRTFLDAVSREALNSALRSDRTLSSDTLRAQHPSVALRVLREWLRSLGLDDVGFDVVNRVYDLILSDDQERSIEVGSGVVVVLESGCLTTLDSFIWRASSHLPIEVDGGPNSWDVLVSDDVRNDDVVLRVPVDAEPVVRTVRPGDRWAGTGRLVREDLREVGIHPRLRPRLLAVTIEDGVLLIPAIYPTIRKAEFDGPVKQVGVRWSRRS